MSETAAKRSPVDGNGTMPGRKNKAFGAGRYRFGGGNDFDKKNIIAYNIVSIRNVPNLKERRPSEFGSVDGLNAGFSYWTTNPDSNSSRPRIVG